MSRTVDLLFKAVYDDTEITPPTFFDYFGMHNNEKNYSTIYGIYAGLIKVKGISKKTIEDCFMANRLDELIHKKYTHYNNSDYYKEFCDKNIKIGNTYVTYNNNINYEEDEEDDENNNKNFEITTDDFCPSCNIEGLYTKDNTIIHLPNYTTESQSCVKCRTGVCKFCANFNKKQEQIICYKCDNLNINSSIEKKIKGYYNHDIEKFGVIGNVKTEDIVKLLNKQKFKCYVCDDVVLTFGWKPNCLYQFSIDRINNSLPHNKDNVLISCYYCNCIDYFTPLNNKRKYKICDNYCHCEKRDIQIKREDISIEKISLLKLNV
jgi:hypothetical protein